MKKENKEDLFMDSMNTAINETSYYLKFQFLKRLLNAIRSYHL